MKDDPISRQAAIDAICGECQGNCIPCEHYPCGEIKALEQLPSIQPERKTGKWIKPNNQVAVAQDEWICSSCHYLVLHRRKVCPKCGARMKE